VEAAQDLIVEARNVSKTFRSKGRGLFGLGARTVHALNDVSLEIPRGKTLALVGDRRDVQIVFQDPYASLSPRMTVQDILMEPLQIHGIGGSRAERIEFCAGLMGRVGLEPLSLYFA